MRGSEQSFINFLLDLVGSAGQVLRCVVLGGAKTSTSNAVLIKTEAQTSSHKTVTSSSTGSASKVDVIDPRVLRALKKKLHEKEEEWLLRKRRPETARLLANAEAEE